MLTTKQYLLIGVTAFPCIAWGLLTLACVAYGNNINHPSWLTFLSGYPMYRILYLLRVLVFLPTLLFAYKNYLSPLYYNDSYHKIYTVVGVLSIFCLLFGLFIKAEFWNYILDGCLVSPLIEELIARFILYGARSDGFRNYTLVAIITSLSFSLMHFGYDATSLTLDKLSLLSKLSSHFTFSLVLCGIFWFVPKLSLLIVIHSLSNLYSIVR
jgi:membrane protease YdiL (CAAX protease family)